MLFFRCVPFIQIKFGECSNEHRGYICSLSPFEIERWYWTEQLEALAVWAWAYKSCGRLSFDSQCVGHEAKKNFLGGGRAPAGSIHHCHRFFVSFAPSNSNCWERFASNEPELIIELIFQFSKGNWFFLSIFLKL